MTWNKNVSKRLIYGTTSHGDMLFDVGVCGYGGALRSNLTFSNQTVSTRLLTLQHIYQTMFSDVFS